MSAKSMCRRSDAHRVGLHEIADALSDMIDLADACLIALAESFETAEILTLDGDFEIYRWGKNKSFRNLVFLN